ncbi:MAG: amino acid adenylation domain-containing protein [Candidatus Aminicenantes bacterium]|jgi:amino acid adenylation domain-containing protein/non-ribosomal peptide synthase protein (TIGR01720 family)
MYKEIDENILLFSSKFLKQKEYWSKKLSGDLVETRFLFDNKHFNPQKTVERMEIIIPDHLCREIMKLSKNSDLSIYIILLAVLKTLIYRRTFIEDITIFSPIYKLTISQDTINDFLAIRTRVDGTMTFKSLIIYIKESVVEAYNNQDYPFKKIIRSLSGSLPELDNEFISNIECRLLNIHKEIHIEYIKEKLSLVFANEGSRLKGYLLYNPGIYKEHDLKLVLRHFLRILTEGVKNVNVRLSRISLLSPEEKKQLLIDFNNTKTDFPGDKKIYHFIEYHARITPDRIALRCGSNEITYRELDEKTIELTKLLWEVGIGSEQPVGIMLDRSPILAASILAVWKAGGAYIPIEPDYPTGRIRFILENSQAAVLLTDRPTLKTHSLTLAGLQGLQLIKDDIHETGPRPQITNFNDLPIPDRSLVNYEKYNHYIGQASIKNSITLQATRGCPYNCAYCHKIWPKSHVVRSAENLFNEVRLFYNMGVRRFAIIDDIFNLNTKNSSRFFQLIIEKGLEVQLFFPNGLRGDLLTKDYIDLMMEAGTVSLALALETASPRLQKLVGKNLNLETLSENIQYICQKYPQVILELFTMHGFPTETREEAMMTLEFIKRHQWIHFPYVEILKVFPNTAMEKLALENGVSKEAILSSENLAFHELPDTLPFDKAFTLKYQADFLSEYFLQKERLKQVLPHQMALLTEDEIVQKYNSYLPVDIKSFADLLEFVEIQPDELGIYNFLDESKVYVPDLNEKLTRCFPSKQTDEDALKVLLLDLSQFFSGESNMLYDVVEPPLGLMYLMTYLNQQLGNRINGKIAKSRNDFNTYTELKELLDRFKPDVIGIRTLTFYREFFHQTVAMIRQWGTAVPIIAGGPYATSSYKELLQDRNIDLVALGEGELTLVELIKAIIKNNGPLPHEEILQEIAGIAFVPGRERHKKRSRHQVILLDESNRWVSEQPVTNPEPINQSADLAYIIYTSGSTGKPKGVMVEHIGMMNHIQSKINTLGISKSSIVAQNASHTFDISVWQLFAGLSRGGKTVIYPHEVIMDPERFLTNIEKDQITVLEVVPSYLSMMLKSPTLKSGQFKMLHYLLVTGEALKPNLITQWFDKYPGIKMVNAYGPTEASDDITHYIMEKSLTGDQVPIGKPIQNLNIYIVDKYLNLLPVGVQGEICVSGIGVGRGYLNDAEKTSQVFMPDPLAKKNRGGKKKIRLYKTGDLGCWHADGTIDFFGRIDNQLKIRGYRIELGEIESRLVNYPGIKDAVVIALQANPESANQEGQEDKYLYAYLLTESKINHLELRNYLLAELPEYMLPVNFVELDHFPLTANGKVDRKAIAKIEVKTEKKYIAPRNKIESKLTEVFQSVLGRNTIGIDENFFMIGGDSIKSIQIASRLHKIGFKLKMRDIFQNPTIMELAPLIKRVEHVLDQSLVTGIVPLTPIQREFLIRPRTHQNHYNQAVMLYREEGFEEELIKTIFAKLTEHHDVLRMTFKKEAGEIVQINNGLDCPLSFMVYDFHHQSQKKLAHEALQTKINELQGSIDLEAGPLIKTALFKLNDGDRLLIVIHHLVTDGVSWRILFEDIESLYTQLKENKGKKKTELPLKTDSYKTWAEKLSQYANTELFLEEKAYWAEIESTVTPRIERDFEVEDKPIKNSAVESFALAEEETNQLLTKVNNAYGTEINDILLCALGLSIREVCGFNRVLISLEAHGREEIFKDIDINRTVGWFTSIYPVILDMSYEQDLARQIKEVKEVLHRVPNGGIGYGMLKYLTAEEYKQEITFQLNPQISFNYLGQFDRDVEQKSFSIAGESVGNTVSKEAEMEYELEINGIIKGGRLVMSIAYNKKQYKPEPIQQLMSQYHRELSRVISHCTAREESELTPSDLTYPHLTIDFLEQLKSQYPVNDIYPLSPMQEGMLFHAIYEEDKSTYFEQLSYRLYGHLDISYVEKSINELLKRYDILRTAFIYEGLERPLQVVLKERKADLFYEDTRETIGDQMGNEEKEAYIREFKEKDRTRPFDLGKDLLMRVSVLRLDESQYEFIWSFHHILMDGWCVSILVTEFSEIYRSFLGNRPYQLPAVKSYRFYIEWLEKQDKSTSETYWLNYLANYEEPASLPRSKAFKAGEGYTNQRISIKLSREKTVALNQLVAKHHVTLNTLCQTIWAILLRRYSSKEDIVFGAVVSGRPAEIEGVESMVGLFINTIPVRIRFQKKKTITQMLKSRQEDAVKSEAHHHYPLYQIQSATSLKHNLLDHIFVFENYPIAERIDGLEGQKKEKQNIVKLKLSNVEIFEQSNYDFNVQINPRYHINIFLDFNEKVYKREFVERVASHLNQVIDQVLDNAEQSIDEIDILTEQEKNRLLYEFNDTKLDYEKEKTLHQLCEAQVNRTPDASALIFTDQCLTYRELNQSANQLAHYLQQKGVHTDAIVAIMVERSVEMVIGLLGILKSGAAYLPIDPDYPGERISLMLLDSSSKLLVTTPILAEEVDKSGRWEGEKVFLNLGKRLACSPEIQTGHRPPATNSGHLAYVIYTSGSTGKPKGVVIEHQSIINTLCWRKDEYEFDADEVVMQIPTFSFDSSVEDIFTPLISGSRLVLIHHQERFNLEYLKDVIVKHRVTHFLITPHFYTTLMNEIDEKLVTLKSVTVAGDGFTEELVKTHFGKLPGAKLYNEYGPTENSVCSTVYKFDPSFTKVLIGKPIHNTRCYITDRNGRLAPLGVSGELCVAGLGLTRGYLNNPELTIEKFILSNSPIYRTGDLARWLPDGNIEFLGRIDTQVKIRGFRIELGEIETMLLKRDEVKEAVVLLREEKSGNPVICAYLVYVPGAQLTVSQLKDFLAEMLPAYMVPTHFLELEKIPLTPTGKIDQKQLPVPKFTPGENYAAPETHTEKIIADIWKEVLGLEEVGVDDNFFDLGGNSLLSIKIAGQFKKVFKRDIPIVTMYRFLTIRSFARFLEQDDTNKDFLNRDRSEKINEGRNRLKQTMKLMKKK